MQHDPKSSEPVPDPSRGEQNPPDEHHVSRSVIVGNDLGKYLTGNTEY